MGVFWPQQVLLWRRVRVFFCAVWESLGVQVVSWKVWYLSLQVFAICTDRVMAKLSPKFALLNHLEFISSMVFAVISAPQTTLEHDTITFYLFISFKADFLA